MFAYTLHSPFLSPLKGRTLISKEGSSKSTYQIILNIKNSSIKFNPGDSIGIIPMNDPALVKQTIAAMKSRNDIRVKWKDKKELTLFEALSYKANITYPSPTILHLLFAKERDPHKKEKLEFLLKPENKEAKITYLAEHQLWDLLQLHEVDATPQEICNNLLPLMPRFYSIASSLNYHKDEIHLLITKVSYVTNGQVRLGVTTHFLCDLAVVNETLIPIYLNASRGFTLPEDDTRDIIMICGGTGLAPFISFVQERLFRKASGKNWLFLGECYRKGDFYYEDFWLDLEKKRFLKLDLAFSRDQAEKIYVQHKMLQKRIELWKWLQKGANIYVCGNAQTIGRAVNDTLLKIIEEEGKMSADKAALYLKDLRGQKRYLKEVY